MGCVIIVTSPNESPVKGSALPLCLLITNDTRVHDEYQKRKSTSVLRGQERIIQYIKQHSIL